MTTIDAAKPEAMAAEANTVVADPRVLGSPEIAEEAETIASRVHEHRFLVACLGVTAPVTVLRHGRVVIDIVGGGEPRPNACHESWRIADIKQLAARGRHAE